MLNCILISISCELTYNCVQNVTCTIVFCWSLLTVSRAFCITLTYLFEIYTKTLQKQTNDASNWQEMIVFKLPSSPWWQKLRKQYSTERHYVRFYFLNSTPLQYGLAFAIKFEKRTKFYLHPYICTVSVSIWGRIWLKDGLSQKMFLDCNHYYL